jgi:DNA ligase-1
MTPLKQAFSECPSYDELCAALLEGGIAELPQRCHLVPGIPVKPMLAKPTKGVQEVLKRLEGVQFTCEWKYDGEKCALYFFYLFFFIVSLI